VYHKLVKSKAKISPEYTRFSSALRQVLQFTKEDLKAAEVKYQQERAGLPKRGPKPKSSVSAPASGNKG